MIYSLKQQIYDYITNHNDGSEEAKSILNHLSIELNYVDTEIASIGLDDLASCPNQRLLRQALNKAEDEDYTIDDCAKLSQKYEQMFAEDFGENIECVIKNMIWK